MASALQDKVGELEVMEAPGPAGFAG